MTGGVPAATIEPLLSDGAVVVGVADSAPPLPCADLARVQYVTCPYPPDSGFVEPAPGFQLGHRRPRLHPH